MPRPNVRMLISFLFVLLPISAAQAVTIKVEQGGMLLGYIDAYTGALSGAANYVQGGDPVAGPANASQTTNIWFYDSAIDGMTFNSTSHVQPGTCSPVCQVQWDIGVSGSTSDPLVLWSDDNSELVEVGASDNFTARWGFGPSTDGGVIGGIAGDDWVVDIDPLLYTNMNSLKVFSNDGSFITLAMATGSAGDIRFSVPEPFSVALLGFGLFVLGLRHRLA